MQRDGNMLVGCGEIGTGIAGNWGLGGKRTRRRKMIMIFIIFCVNKGSKPKINI